MQAAITGIEFFLPRRTVSTSQLAAEFPEWDVDKIESKTGISNRHIADDGECSSDLAFNAAQKLFETGACSPADIDYILLCTQSPDYFLPTTACLLQARLGIPTTAGALDFNLGCSGFVYGLGLARGLIDSGQARKILLLTAETYSKFIHVNDKSVRTIFGDGAAATLVEAVEIRDPAVGPFVFGTDGRGANNLIVPTGGFRCARTPESAVLRKDKGGSWRTGDNLFMEGTEIFGFTLDVIPRCVGDLLAKSGKTKDDIDLFVFHQANLFMLEHLRKRLGISEQKFCIEMRESGNTVSSTIPIALRLASENGKLKKGDCCMLVGFGVGYSWGATIIHWL
jgi:3-oxoacyl-[acyl-carrier-protein] synthase-3